MHHILDKSKGQYRYPFYQRKSGVAILQVSSLQDLKFFFVPKYLLSHLYQHT